MSKRLVASEFAQKLVRKATNAAIAEASLIGDEPDYKLAHRRKLRARAALLRYVAMLERIAELPK